MNDETTRLINEEPAQKEQNTNVHYSTTEKAQPKKSRKTNPIAAGVGGFVAGAAVGVGSAAFASTPTAEEELTVVAEEAEQQEPVTAPEPEQVILANDEGIRYAHVEADSFGEAYAQARQQVGPGGVFEYNGKIYSTYTYEEWHEMSEQERADYQGRVFENVPAPRPEAPHSQAQSAAAPAVEATVEAVAEEVPESPSEKVEVNSEMISAEPVDSEIRVLGVEAVQNDAGEIMNVALVECEGDQALLVDVDNNGTIDVLLHDDNGDGQLQEPEVYDISEAGLEVSDLLQAQAVQDGNVLYASNDDMPDYVNDADSIMTV